MSVTPVIPTFDNWGVKTVAPNDIAKKAFVPMKSQTGALSAAGIAPAHGNSFDITILFDPAVSKVRASYYHSMRAGSGRPAEPRMGRPFVSSWMKSGDQVVIGNIGNTIYAYKVTPFTPLPAPPAGSASSAAGASPSASVPAAASAAAVPPTGGIGSSGGIASPAAAPAQASDRALVEAIVRTESAATIMAQARNASGVPARKSVARADFARNLYVVAGALLRANGKCEMPGCTHPLFAKDDGTPFLEVHHVVPLGEGGDDSLANASALCPHCHRRLHFGADRMPLRSKLAAYIASLP